MRRSFKDLAKIAMAVSISVVFVVVYARQHEGRRFMPFFSDLQMPEDTTKESAGDTTKLKYPIRPGGGSMDLKPPGAVKKQVELDSSMQYYKVRSRVGNEDVGDEQTITFDEYQRQQNEKMLNDYFKRRSQSQSNITGKNTLILGPDSSLLNKALQLVEIKPQGSATLIFSEEWNRVQNPTWSLREQRNAQFKFDQKLQVSVIGNIGDKIKMGIRYDTEAAFDFEQQRNIKYDGKDDEIIKTIQVGDINMPTGGTLISGSQSLFGIKTRLQFGKLFIDAVYSQKKSEKKEITLEGGAQKNKFDIQADQYDVNRHFFLAQYFEEHYNEWNERWPSLNDIQITRVDVWVSNVSITPTNTRPVAALMDLGEPEPFNTTVINPGTINVPANNANDLYQQITAAVPFRQPVDVTKELDNMGLQNNREYYLYNNARQLSPTEFTFHSKLGYISLNSAMNPNDLLAVAFEYTKSGKVYQVGEFSRDIEVSGDSTKAQTILVKMLKSPAQLDPKLPMWDLMMKNIYSLNAYQVQPKDFRLDVIYAYDNGNDQTYLPVPNSETALNGQVLLRVTRLDKLNVQQELKPDGMFDYLEGITINSSNGRIIFPVLEPFGSDLYKKFQDKELAEKFVFQELYDSTQAAATQVAQKNKFFLRGSYQSASGAVISLNSINVPQGSVKVTANGVPLQEGSQYTVDYTLGRVTITDESVLNSGSVIKVESESTTLFNIQQKTLMGTRAEYQFTKDFSLGSTLLYLRERPLTPKVNVGDEPIRNAIVGIDGRYRTDSRFLTKLVDRIPLIETKEKSIFAAEFEAARVFPGHPKTLNDATDSDRGGVSYLDDFEGSLSPYDLRLGGYWVMASTPQGQPERFPEAISTTPSLEYGFKRAQLSWYIIDNIFFRDNAQLTPPNILNNTAILSNMYQREVREIEVFPNRQIPNGTPGTLQTFDLQYHPSERGPYNFTTNGLNSQGRLKDPRNSWGGIMRKIDYNNFEQQNIEYIEFWVMDPFHYNPGAEGGDLYIDLGNISEDILRDNQKSYENGLPITEVKENVETTVWGYVPNGIQINNAFSNDPNARQYQDVGYDGLRSVDEVEFYKDYLAAVDGIVTNADALNQIKADPSNDNFKFFQHTDYDNANADILKRYSRFNGTEGNTPIQSSNAIGGYGSQYPDDEDINRDFNLDRTEDYFEYKVRMRPADMKVGQNFITDIQTATVPLRNNTTAQVKWYQFKVPIRSYNKRVGNIPDFKSIRFIRLYLTGFQDSVVLRFARLQLIRGDWRRYLNSLKTPGDYLPGDSSNTTLDIAAVNLEENGKRPGIPYVLPPGIIRETDYSTPNLIQQNEQSLSLRVCNLEDGDARAVFKNTNFDIRQYKRLRMFVHAENLENNVQDGEASFFIRVGADFNTNYYEYEIPLKMTRRPNDNRDQIWPVENRIDLLMEEFINAKLERNLSGSSISIPYEYAGNTFNGRVTVLGNPDIGNVRTIMLGVRNPKRDGNPNDNGRTLPCIEVWANELRVADFNEQGGWAAVGRVTTQLADFGRVELTGSRRTIGFGGIEQTVQERSQEDTRSYGLNSSFQLGKFFPKRFNVSVPMYFAYNELISRPRYNPLSPDVEFTKLKEIDKEGVTYDSLVKVSEDFTSRKSLNFTGVQKLRGANVKRSPRIYDIENFNATYVFSEVFRRNITSKYDFEKTYSGILGYTYTFKPKVIQPFKKISSPYLKLISDINLSLLPQSFAVSARIDRKYAERLFRNTDNVLTIIEPQYNKNFTMGRKYDFRYNLTRSLRLTYGSTVTSRIEEPYGELDSAWKRQEVWNNIKDGGKLTQFQQNLDLTYDVPISKLPMLDWTSLQATYKGGYEWQNAPPAAPSLGNTIQNSQALGLNGQLNFISLYNKNEFLRNILNGKGNAESLQNKRQKELDQQAKTDSTKKNAQAKVNVGSVKAGETALRLIMSLRTVSFIYSENRGTLLPGFMPVPQLLGQDFGLGSRAAGAPPSGGPGLAYVFGSQADIRPQAVANGWMTTDTNLSNQFLRTYRQNLSGQAVLEPLKDLRINASFERQRSTNYNEIFRQTGKGEFESLSPFEQGSYSVSVWAFKSTFDKTDEKKQSEAFDRFQANRRQVAYELADANPLAGTGRLDSAGYPYGYGRANQDVIIPAFLQAYTGKSGNSIFPNMPAPSWRITYTGLSGIKAVKKIAKQVSISHGYRATYSIDNYKTSLNYDPLQAPVQGKDLVNQFIIDRISLQESFDPIIGFDINWVNNITSRFEYKKSRTLSFSFIDRKLSENLSQEVVLGIGYRTSKVYLPRFNRRRKRLYLENDLNFRLDFSIRDNIQTIRILDNDVATEAGGQRLFSLTPNLTYALSKSLTLTLFFKRNTNKPHTTNQYPTALTSVGFQLRYVLTP